MNAALKKRIKVHERYEGHCGYCGKEITFEQMQVDHIMPKCMGSLNSDIVEGVWVDQTNHIDNLMPTCRRCNHYKRAETLERFRIMMQTLHTRIEKQYINKVAIDYGIIKLQPWDGIFYFEKFNKLLQ